MEINQISRVHIAFGFIEEYTLNFTNFEGYTRREKYIYDIINSKYEEKKMRTRFASIRLGIKLIPGNNII